MDFNWTPEQEKLRKDAIEFAKAELNEDLLARETQGAFPYDDWKRCAEFGIQGLLVPRELGGRGLPLMDAIAVLEGLGYGCRDNGLPFALNSQIWSHQAAIMKFGSNSQKERYLPALCSGEAIGAFGITEAESGSDTFSLQMRAEKQGGDYVLNGTKLHITLAPVATLAVVFASTDPDRGRWGISVFVVEHGTPGFSRSEVRSKMGMRTCPIGELVFENCRIPEENRIGPEGAGASIFSAAMESERGYIFASQLGAMERQLEEAIDYARRRRQFGQPIGKFQSVAHRIAEMKLRLETSRLLLYRAAWRDAIGEPAPMDAALAKLHLSECFLESSLDAVRNYGAQGFMTAFEAERDLRDSVGGLVYSGTSDIQRTIVARLLGL